MNKDEDYGFDVAGYLHIPQLLSADEIEACNQAIDAVGREDGMLDWPEPWCDPFRALQEHAVLQPYLESLCGTGFAQDRSPVLVSGGSGYLVLRGVMDEAWLGAANRAIEAALAMQEELPEDHPTKLEEVRETALIYNDGEWPKDTSSRLRGDIHRPRLGGLYLLPKPHCEPFHRMIAQPAITRRLNWMLGYGHSETGEPMCCEYPQGTTGGSLHGQNTAGFYRLEGRSMVEKVNVAWALHDEAPGFGKESGGFVCIPGSHKASYPIPRGLTTSIDLPQVYKPPLKAGDVLLFGALAHGTTAWRASWHRRTVIQFMGSPNVSIKPANPVVGWRGRRLSGSWRV